MTTLQKIPWLRIGAESVAIIASILLAFAIDAWWSARSDAMRTNDLLLGLEREWHSVLEETSPEQNALMDTSLVSLRAARQDVAHRLNLPIVNSTNPSTAEMYGPESGRYARAVFIDDEVIRVHRRILDLASDYESQLRETRRVLALNIGRLERYLEHPA